MLHWTQMSQPPPSVLPCLRIPQQILPLLFNGADNPTIDLSLGVYAPYLIHDFLCPPDSAPRPLLPKRHLDRLSRFCTAHEREQHTDRHTNRTRYCYVVCGNRPLSLTNAPMQPKHTRPAIFND